MHNNFIYWIFFAGVVCYIQVIIIYSFRRINNKKQTLCLAKDLQGTGLFWCIQKKKNVASCKMIISKRPVVTKLSPKSVRNQLKVTFLSPSSIKLGNPRLRCHANFAAGLWHMVTSCVSSADKVNLKVITSCSLFKSTLHVADLSFYPK